VKGGIGRLTIHGVADAGADCFVDLLGEIEILPRHGGKKSIEKMKAPQLG